MRCRAKVKNGNNCKNMALKGSSFCFVHRSHIDVSGIGASAQIKRLEKELKQVKIERDILKKAAAYFSQAAL